MDPEAAARARRKTFVHDLTRVTTDDEACPPEWTDILIELRREMAGLEQRIADEVRRFASEPDVRVALARRERTDAQVRARVAELNEKVKRLNLIAPLTRFQRTELDADELLRPLYRTRRSTTS